MKHSILDAENFANLIVELDGFVNDVLVALLEPQMFPPARLNKPLRAANTRRPRTNF